MKYGQETFSELEHIIQTGYCFQGIQHSVEVVCCCDWKAAACIEGTIIAKSKFKSPVTLS